MDVQQILKNIQLSQLNDLQNEVVLQAKSKQNLQILAPTGSGKTLSFLIPLIQYLEADFKGIQALIIVPSRELALQIEQVFRQINTGFKIVCCYGGHSVKVEKNNLLEPPTILVGTPGRLSFHLREQHIDLENVHTLVLDEFDKSLTLGFSEDMALLIDATNNLKNRILTSATTLDILPDFINSVSFNEINFLENNNYQPNLTVKYVTSSPEDKLETLFRLICKLGNQRILIFCNHRQAVNRISELLIEQELIHDIYHGGLEQDERERALVKFRNKSLNILIASDLAARGLDIPEIDSIIHYQLPLTEDAFIHRNGRTARMTKSGTIYLCLTAEEQMSYLTEEMLEEELPNNFELPQDTLWQTLYFSLGKKDKINKIDVLGFLIKVGEINKDDIGLIEIKDFNAYVAVKRTMAELLVEKLHQQKIKGKKIKVALAM